MWSHLPGVVVMTLLINVTAIPDVDQLQGDPDFRSVRLQWRYLSSVPDLHSFRITYCEDQAWGKNRCRLMDLEDASLNEIASSDLLFREFHTEIPNLRMSTNYTVEVTPVLHLAGGGAPTTSPSSVGGRGKDSARAMGREIIVTTKGFSAKATECLTTQSVVEVETGPNFGGKVGVENSEDPQCFTQGDRKSPQSKYLLRIQHSACGSQVLNSSVLTYVIVQENLPILTHSTKRFVVVCTYVPETFTVRAGVNLPEDGAAGGGNLMPVNKTVTEMDPSELFDSTNNLLPRLPVEVGRALRMSAGDGQVTEPRMWSQLILMVILIVAAVVGLSCAVWHFVMNSSGRRKRGFSTPLADPPLVGSQDDGCPPAEGQYPYPEYPSNEGGPPSSIMESMNPQPSFIESMNPQPNFIESLDQQSNFIESLDQQSNFIESLDQQSNFIESLDPESSFQSFVPNLVTRPDFVVQGLPDQLRSTNLSGLNDPSHETPTTHDLDFGCSYPTELLQKLSYDLTKDFPNHGTVYESYNPSTRVVTHGPDKSVDFDKFGNPFGYINYSMMLDDVPGVLERQSRGLVLLDPRALYHHSPLEHLPIGAENYLGVTLSSQEVSLEGEVIQYLEYEDSHESGEGTSADSETNLDLEDCENHKLGHATSDESKRSSLTPSLRRSLPKFDPNWRLADKDGQMFPALFV